MNWPLERARGRRWRGGADGAGARAVAVGGAGARAAGRRGWGGVGAVAGCGCLLDCPAGRKRLSPNRSFADSGEDLIFF